MSGGHADPPMPTNLSVVSFLFSFRKYCRRPSQTVGTAAVIVTFSVSRRSNTEAPSSLGPGITMRAPRIGQESARPQELAWNIGTTGRTESSAVTVRHADVLAIVECRRFERCEYRTPFGFPVVPDV